MITTTSAIRTAWKTGETTTQDGQSTATAQLEITFDPKTSIVVFAYDGDKYKSAKAVFNAEEYRNLWRHEIGHREVEQAVATEFSKAHTLTWNAATEKGANKERARVIAEYSLKREAANAVYEAMTQNVQVFETNVSGKTSVGPTYFREDVEIEGYVPSVAWFVEEAQRVIDNNEGDKKRIREAIQSDYHDVYHTPR